MIQAHAVIDEKLIAPFSLADEQFGALKIQLASTEVRAMTHGALEKLLDVEGRELLRRLLQDHLTLRAQQERELGVVGPVVGADGVIRTHMRESDRKLVSLFGEVTVARLAHGGRGTTGLHPQDAALNLPVEQFSHGVRRRAGEEAARGSFDEAVKSIAATTGAAVAKRQLEQLVVRAATDIEKFYAGREALEPSVVANLSGILVITTDAKGIVMRVASLRELTRIAAQQRVPKLERRLCKGEKRNRKRMAQVAAVYTVAAHHRTPEDIVGELDSVRGETKPTRPKPEHKRVWASLDDPEVVIRQAFEEALRRDPQRTKRWIALSDGNGPQLQLLKKLALEFGVKLIVILDIIHVVEYLWKATTVFNKEGSPEAEAWVTARFLNVLRGKASHVAAGIRRSATLRGYRAAKRKPADVCANYLLKYSEYMRYDMYLDLGFPIATGVIEGACRHLVKDRMDLTGARWGLERAEAVLRLRSLRSSGDFDEYWAFHEQRELERNHGDHYANGEIPPMCQPRGSRAHLRLVN